MAGFSPNSVAVGDFNGDGRQDLATANIHSNNVTILLGDVAVPALAAPTAAPATRLEEAVEDRLVAEVVVGVA